MGLSIISKNRDTEHNISILIRDAVTLKFRGKIFFQIIHKIVLLPESLTRVSDN